MDNNPTWSTTPLRYLIHLSLKLEQFQLLKGYQEMVYINLIQLSNKINKYPIRMLYTNYVCMFFHLHLLCPCHSTSLAPTLRRQGSP